MRKHAQSSLLLIRTECYNQTRIQDHFSGGERGYELKIHSYIIILI